MKDTNFFLGILAIMALYYLFTRGISEGNTNLGDSTSTQAAETQNQSSLPDLKLLPDVQQMQAINKEIDRVTKEMAREQALQQRNIPLHPVPEQITKSKEKISHYLGSISNYMRELAIKSDGKMDEEEVVEIEERSHARGEPTYTQPAKNQQGSHKTHPDWYTFPMGNPSSSSNAKTSSSHQFKKLDTTSQGDVTQFTPKVIYQRRPYNRITPAELKKWFGSTANVKKENPTIINKNVVVKYKH